MAKGSELATAYLTLVPSLKGAQKTIEKQLKGVNTASAGKQMGDSAASGFGSGFNIKNLAVAAASSAAVAAAAEFVKSSVGSYADYEQLVGGVETLFKDSAGKLQDYAAAAYQTAGMSANEYMELSTAFAASLLQSLEGDTDAAVEYANRAITDMSDNANKMGTDIEMIKNAYQGFAKANYTMLDNLKLGYGGTKEEMERLLEDAQALSGIKYDISSYSDIVDAIHVIQTEMDISGLTAQEAAEAIVDGTMTAEEAFEAMGTTAKEATTTIEGSLKMASGAWSNWLTALATDELDLGVYTENLVNAVVIAAKNVIPRIGQVFNSVGEVMRTHVPFYVSQFADFLYATENPLAQFLSGILTGNMFEDIEHYIGLLPGVLTDGFDKAISVISGSVPVRIAAFIRSLLTSAGTLFQTMAPSIMQNSANMWIAIADAIPSILPLVINGAVSLVNSVVETLPTLVPILTESALALFESLVSALPVILPKLVEGAMNIIDSVATMLPTLIPMLFAAAGTLFMALVDAVPSIAGSLLSAVGSLLTQAKDRAVAFKDDMLQAGKDIVLGMANGIWEAGPAIWNAIKSVCSSALDVVLKFFGIASPSKVMREMFGYVGEGMALGLEDKSNRVIGAMRGVSHGVMGAASVGATTYGASGSRDVTYNIYIDGAQVNSDNAIEGAFYGFMTELQRLGVMQGGVA